MCGSVLAAGKVRASTGIRMVAGCPEREIVLETVFRLLINYKVEEYRVYVYVCFFTNFAVRIRQEALIV